MNGTTEKTMVRWTYDEGSYCYRDETDERVEDNTWYPLPWGGRVKVADVESRPDLGPAAHDSYIVWADSEGTEHRYESTFSDGSVILVTPGGVEELPANRVKIRFTYDANAVCFRGFNGERFSEVGWQNLPGGAGYLIAPVGPTVHHRILHVEIPGLNPIEFLPRCEDRGGFVLDAFTGEITEFDPPAQPESSPMAGGRRYRSGPKKRRQSSADNPSWYSGPDV